MPEWERKWIQAIFRTGKTLTDYIIHFMYIVQGHF